MKSVRIVGRFDSFTGIGRHGWSFVEALAANENDLSLEIVPTNHNNLPDISHLRLGDKATVTLSTDIKELSDYSVFCDVIGQTDKRLHRLGKINIIYFAWDSSEIPDYFANIINSDFDLCVVPSKFVKQTLINSGVELDIIVLPLVLKKLQRSEARVSELPIFGFIGSYEERKNVDLLIDLFHKALGDQAVLRIHLTYSHLAEDSLHKLLRRWSGSNIQISTGVLDDAEYTKLLGSFDCFISLSMGEGYSIIPREFMFLERPLILSHSSAHQDIPALDGIVFLESRVPYPARYPQIDGNVHGVFYGPFHEDVLIAIRDVFKNLNNTACYSDLSEYASSLTAKELAEFYRGIFEPKCVIASAYASHISRNRSLTLKSPPLINKYQLDFQATLSPNKHVVLANDGGFFSVFNRYVSILVHELERDPSSIIIPDWRIEALVEYLGAESFSSFCYGTRDDGNIFLKIFKPPFDFSENLYNDPNFLRDDAHLRTDYNERLEPDLTYIHAYKLYKRSDFQAWRELYHRYFKKHISLKDDLNSEIEDFAKTNFDDYFVVSAHIRHPSHSMEQPSGRLPTVEVFKEHIERELKTARESQKKPLRLFIASDQESVIEYFRIHFPEIIVTTHASRATKMHDAIFEKADAIEKQKEGYQIQHIMASDSSSWSVKMANDVIIDTWLLSRTQVFIHITSNIATAVSYINPNVKMVYCS